MFIFHGVTCKVLVIMCMMFATVPGEMDRPTVQGINSSMVLVSWNPPRNPAGLLNYYEVAVIKVDSHNERNHSISSNVTAIAYGKLCFSRKSVPYRIR